MRIGKHCSINLYIYINKKNDVKNTQKSIYFLKN